MNPFLSVVIPAYNAEACIGEAVRAVLAQPMPAGAFECLVVDDGSTDGTAAVAERAGAKIVRLGKNQGRCAARNAGVAAARGEWIVFTDADCVPSRRWLPSYWAAMQAAGRSATVFTGKILGLPATSAAARFADLTGALDPEKYLQNEALPWAPTGNLALRREDFLAVGGFDPRYKSYEAADLQMRLNERFTGVIVMLPTALVMHRHRDSWGAYWRQQVNYGEGYAQFLLRYAGRWPWTLRRELTEWFKLVPLAARALMTRGDRGLVYRGTLIKQAAHRVGFSSIYYSLRERWLMRLPLAGGSPATLAVPIKKNSRLRGAALPLWLAVGHFMQRAPRRLARMDLPAFLDRLSAEPSGRANQKTLERITRRWCRLPGWRAKDTCYVRSLILFRFLAVSAGDLSLHFGVDERRSQDERWHGHAWVSLDGVPLNPPPSLAEGRIREIYRYSRLTGGISTAGETSAAARLREVAVSLGQ